jgi:branched-subunit amino acid aminotransferase/4-amino-4-deoxychorismate lyase
MLWNPLREVTEATTANVVAELDGARDAARHLRVARRHFAPSCWPEEIQERVLTLDDLQSASRLWLINSVYEWREAILSA